MNSDRVSQGLGIITFFADGVASALVRSVSDVEWQRGQYVVGHGVDIDTDKVRLTLRTVDRPTDNGPRLRGTLVVKATGETGPVVGWHAKLEDGTKCIGLSADRPLPSRIAAPF